MNENLPEVSVQMREPTDDPPRCVRPPFDDDEDDGGAVVAENMRLQALRNE